MKGLLVVAGLASGLALVTGGLLLAAAPRGEPPAEPSAPARPLRAVPEEDGPDPVTLEARIRALESRIAELQASGAARPAAPEVPVREPSPKERAPAGTEIAWDMTLEEFVKSYGDRFPTEPAADPASGKEAKDAKKEPKQAQRWEKEIRRRLERAAQAMALTEFEKSRAEEILRGHVEKSEAIAVRAREALTASAYGFSPADRSVVLSIKQERDRLLVETQQSLVQLVGQARFAEYLKSEKAQNEKEAAVKALERPW